MAVDFDSLFSYSTSRRVKIKDRRLGLLNFLGKFAIVCYIIIYVVFAKQGFRDEVPVIGDAKLMYIRDSAMQISTDTLQDFCAWDDTVSAIFLNSFWGKGMGKWSADGTVSEGSGSNTGMANADSSGSETNVPSGNQDSSSNSKPVGPRLLASDDFEPGLGRRNTDAGWGKVFNKTRYKSGDSNFNPPSSKGQEPADVRWDLLNLSTDGKNYKLPCYFVPADMTILHLPPEGLFISTRRNTSMIDWIANPCAPFSPECNTGPILRSVQYPAFSSFQTFRLLHSVRSDPWLYATGDDLEGRIKWPESGEATFGYGAQDLASLTYTLGDLLYLAGESVKKDDATGHFQPTIQHRANGGIILVDMAYANGRDCHSWWYCFPGEDDVKYEISVRILVDGYEFAHTPVAVSTVERGTTWVRQWMLEMDDGWLILCRQQYRIAVWDLPTFVVNCCAALGLLSVVKVSIDQLALRALPLRGIYKKLMFIETTDKDMWDHAGKVLQDTWESAEKTFIAATSPISKKIVDAKASASDDEVEPKGGWGNPQKIDVSPPNVPDNDKG